MKDSKFAVARLHQLNSKLDRVLEFRARQEEEPSTLGKIAKGAAIVGGVGALGYGVGSYVRGSRSLQNSLGRPMRSMNERMAALRIGNKMNVSDAKAGIEAIRKNATLANGKAFVQEKAGQAKDAVVGAYGKAKTGATGAYEKVKSKLYRGSRS
jgi:hypothetical protein